MRVAFVVSNLTYPPVEGLHRQTLLSIQRIKALGHDVNVFGFCKELDRLNRSALVSELGISFTEEPISSRLPDILLGIKLFYVPLLLQRGTIRHLYKTICFGGYDAIHFEHVGACGLVRRQIARKSLLALVDPGSLRFRRFAAMGDSALARMKSRGIAVLHSLFERSLSRTGSIFQVVSSADAAFLREHLQTDAVAAIPLTFPSSLADRQLKEGYSGGEIRGVVFLDLRQKHLRDSFRWFVERVYRPFTEHGRRLPIVVMGRVKPDAELLELALGLPIQFLEWAKDHVEVLAEADVILTPDRAGTGLKNRVVESMALGKPVVGTEVAFEGIPAESGKDAWVASNEKEMMSALEWVHDNPSDREKMGERAREFAIEIFGEANIRQEWDALYCELQMRGKHVQVAGDQKRRSSAAE